MTRILRKCLLITLLSAWRAGAQLPPERAAARAWFQDAKFGMFIHWGVYSQLGQGEWVMENRGISTSAYEWLASTFNPVRFDAAAWVALARAAGMRYITITSKHHDGFCMFDSKLTNYDIVDATPFKRDPLKELAAECRRHSSASSFSGSRRNGVQSTML